MAGQPTAELYYDPFDHAIDDDPYSVWKRMRVLGRGVGEDGRLVSRRAS